MQAIITWHGVPPVILAWRLLSKHRGGGWDTSKYHIIITQTLLLFTHWEDINVRKTESRWHNEHNRAEKIENEGRNRVFGRTYQETLSVKSTNMQNTLVPLPICLIRPSVLLFPLFMLMMTKRTYKHIKKLSLFTFADTSYNERPKMYRVMSKKFQSFNISLDIAKIWQGEKSFKEGMPAQIAKIIFEGKILFPNRKAYIGTWS